MKIIVMMKQVANKDAILRINKDATWSEEGDLSFEVSESDGYAPEEALRVREKLGGEVIVCSMGPQRVKSVIKDALARGADRAIHVTGDNLTHLTPYAAATILADAIRDEKPDLGMTGLQSDDMGYGQTGVVMAELLGLPHSTIIMQAEVDGPALRGKRELEDGWFQHIRMPLPAVLTIQSGINKLRYATLMGIKRAKTKEIRRLTAADLGVGPAGSVAVIERVYPPAKTKQAQIFEGDARSAAAKLVEKLKYEARIL